MEWSLVNTMDQSEQLWSCGCLFVFLLHCSTNTGWSIVEPILYVLYKCLIPQISIACGQRNAISQMNSSVIIYTEYTVSPSYVIVWYHSQCSSIKYTKATVNFVISYYACFREGFCDIESINHIKFMSTRIKTYYPSYWFNFRTTFHRR